MMMMMMMIIIIIIIIIIIDIRDKGTQEVPIHTMKIYG